MTDKNTHYSRCNLRAICTLAGGDKCAPVCPSFVALHGFNGVGGRVGAANVPDEYRNITVADSPVRSEQTDAYALVDNYVAKLKRQFEADSPRIKSLYLHSLAPGTGKTTTAAAILNEYINVNYVGSLKRGITPLERPAYFLDVNAWQTLYLGFNRSHSPQSVAEPLAAEYYAQEQRAKLAPFTVLDDVGVRSASDAFRSDFHTVINYRAANGLATVYTSNVPITELSTIFDARLADRVRDMCVSIAFTGESKRGMR
jgi:DNA replication protein DnaC